MPVTGLEAGRPVAGQAESRDLRQTARHHVLEEVDLPVLVGGTNRPISGSARWRLSSRTRSAVIGPALE